MYLEGGMVGVSKGDDVVCSGGGLGCCSEGGVC